MLLDHVMVGISGQEASSGFLGLNPKAQVIIATADIQLLTYQQAKVLGVFGLVNKPYHPASMLKMVSVAVLQAEK